MLSLKDPFIEDAVAGVAWPALADWLNDRGATPADLAQLYAGSPPDHEDGIDRECLALWLEHAREDPGGAKAVRAESPAHWPVYVPGTDGQWLDEVRADPVERPAALSLEVSQCGSGSWVAVHCFGWLPGCTNEFRLPVSLSLGSSRVRLRLVDGKAEGLPGVHFLLHAMHITTVWSQPPLPASAVARDLKRRVLALPWAEGVRVERRVGVKLKLWKQANLPVYVLEDVYGPSMLAGAQGDRNMLHARFQVLGLLGEAGIFLYQGVRINCHYDPPGVGRDCHRRAVFSQTLTAPQLIASEVPL